MFDNLHIRHRLKRRHCIYCSRPHFENLPQSGSREPVVIIKERDVGFFSLFLQVINTLLAIEKEKLPCTPCIDFGSSQSYYSGTNTWTQFFEQISSGAGPIKEADIERVNRSFRKHGNHMQFWDEMGSVYKVRRDLYWTASYYPKFTTNSSSHHMDHKRVPSTSEREAASAVIRKYIHPLPKIQTEVDRFVNEHLASQKILGVQFRGTDARTDETRKIPTYDIFFGNIEKQLASMGDGARIFVASDEQSFVDAMKDKFDIACSYAAVRHQHGEDLDSKGPTGGLMPAFIMKDTKAALTGAIMDYLLLCRSNVIIHNVGSLSNTALLTNPEMISIPIGENIKAT